MTIEGQPNYDPAEVTRDALRVVVQQGRRVTQILENLLDDHHGDGSQEVAAAAFDFIKNVGIFGGNMMDGHGQIIFNGEHENHQTHTDILTPHTTETCPAKAKRGKRNKNSQDINPDTSAGEDKKDDLKPTTFAQLLRLKIDQVLPPGPTIWRKELYGYFAKSRIRQLLTNGGVIENPVDRVVAVKAIQDYLAAPTEKVHIKKAYDKLDLRHSFRPSIEQLDQWATEIGHNWQANPTVDYETAKQIRGLYLIERYLQKKTEKGL